MPESDMKQALDLLKAAQCLLAQSELKNLRISAEYLHASIKLLSKGAGKNCQSPSAQRSR
ncbi:MAG: hypothetical protein C0619_14910 [Desulfuromonas sp.]|nr:MAG: hypothetical protein C0619_14910 [Desulfuromonas sp.]